MPKGVVAAESSAICRTIGLHGLAPRERTGTTGGFGRVPLATILGDDVVEKSAENGLGPAGIGVVGIIRRPKMERLPFACCNALQSGTQVDCA